MPSCPPPHPSQKIAAVMGLSDGAAACRGGGNGTGTGGLTVQELRAWAGDRLPKYQVCTLG